MMQIASPLAEEKKTNNRFLYVLTESQMSDHVALYIANKSHSHAYLFFKQKFKKY